MQNNDFVADSIDRVFRDLNIHLEADDEAFIRTELIRLIEEEPSVAALRNGADPRTQVLETGEIRTVGEARAETGSRAKNTASGEGSR